MSKTRVLLSIIVLLLLLVSTSPTVLAYEGKVRLPPMEDGVPGEYTLYANAHWGDMMRSRFEVEPKGVDFFIVRPNLQVHKSIRSHGTSTDETYLPETGTYMLVWKNREAFEQTLQFDVTIEPRHLSLYITTIVVVFLAFGSLIYLRLRKSRTGP